MSVTTLFPEFPAAPNRSTDAPATFSSKADAFVSAMYNFPATANVTIGQMNTLLNSVNTYQANATGSAASAASSAASASASATTATTAKNNAQTYANNASTSASGAATSEANAAQSASNASASASSASISEANAASSEAIATQSSSSASLSAASATDSALSASASSSSAASSALVAQGAANFKGTWVSTTTYSQGQSVYYNNDFFVSVNSENIGHTPDPTITTYWISVSRNIPQYGTGGDLNSCTRTGKYYFYGTPSNAPAGVASCYVDVMASATTYIVQTAINALDTSSGTYIRTMINGTWSVWIKLATTADVSAAVAALVASSPATLDTLKELATALGNDPNFATTMTNALAAKAPLASPALTGTPTAPTPSAYDNSSKIVTSNWFYSAIGTVATALGFAWSFGANGYIKLPNWLKNLMFQWGYVDSSGANTDTTWTFPTTFPSGWLFAVASPNVAGSTDYASITSVKGATSSLTFRKSNGGASTRTLLFVVGY